jgi:hypothetical protein
VWPWKKIPNFSSLQSFLITMVLRLLHYSGKCCWLRRWKRRAPNENPVEAKASAKSRSAARLKSSPLVERLSNWTLPLTRASLSKKRELSVVSRESLAREWPQRGVERSHLSVLLTTSILILLRCYVHARMHLKPSHTYLLLAPAGTTIRSLSLYASGSASVRD